VEAAYSSTFLRGNELPHAIIVISVRCANVGQGAGRGEPALVRVPSPFPLLYRWRPVTFHESVSYDRPERYYTWLNGYQQVVPVRMGVSFMHSYITSEHHHPYVNGGGLRVML
jgi:hypothetical protein